MDGTGSGSCPVVGFGISSVEPWGSATTVLDLMEIGCEDGRWMELAQDCVQWWALVLAVLNLGVLLPQCQRVGQLVIPHIRHIVLNTLHKILCSCVLRVCSGSSVNIIEY